VTRTYLALNFKEISLEISDDLQSRTRVHFVFDPCTSRVAFLLRKPELELARLAEFYEQNRQN
jgi:hypothetical protein